VDNDQDWLGFSGNDRLLAGIELACAADWRLDRLPPQQRQEVVGICRGDSVFIVAVASRNGSARRNTSGRKMQRGINIFHETVPFWWIRFAPLFAAEIKKRRIRHR